MVAINATSQRLQAETSSGIRPFDIGRDLRPVAELIADAFTHELDPRGMAALREMRIMSHLSGLIKLLSRGTGDFDDVFSGFVWVEDRRIVGNITVQRGDKFGNRWQIANVAVAQDQRGRGIARRLMERGLEHITASGGRWAVLQVYDHNAVARRLYDHLGFEGVGGSVDLRLERTPRAVELPSIAGLRTFSASSWQPLYELANAQLGGTAQWWRSIRRTDFQLSIEQQFGEWLSRVFGRNQVFRRCVQTTRRFEAAMILNAQRWRGVHKLEMWVRPEQYGELEEPLLQWALAALAEYPRYPIIASLAAEHTTALDVFERYGFSRRQTLLTMRKRLGE